MVYMGISYMAFENESSFIIFATRKPNKMTTYLLSKYPLSLNIQPSQ